MEMYLPHSDRSDFLRKLVHVLFGGRITLIESTFENMRKFIELPEFPSCKGSISAASDSRGILVIFL